MGKIFWFSATGNSFKAAEMIAQKAGKYELVKITDSLISSSPLIADKEVGFVFPVYGWTIPKPVIDFIKVADFKNTEYCFSLITMGGSAAKAGLVLKKLLSKKGVTLSFLDTAAMPDNCIYLFDTPSSKGEAHIAAFLEKSRLSLNVSAEKISRHAYELNVSRNIFGFLLTYLAGSSFSMQYKGFDKKFNVSDACNGCGICRDICSVSNITIEEGRPVFHGSCVICMGCINWCPHKAIDYKGKIGKRTQYHHPDVSVSDMKG